LQRRLRGKPTRVRGRQDGRGPTKRVGGLAPDATGTGRRRGAGLARGGLRLEHDERLARSDEPDEPLGLGADLQEQAAGVPDTVAGQRPSPASAFKTAMSSRQSPPAAKSRTGASGARERERVLGDGPVQLQRPHPLDDEGQACPGRQRIRGGHRLHLKVLKR